MATKDERIGLRLPRELKVELQNIAKREGRSLAQVCELLLKGGILEYERTGPDYLRRLLVRTGSKAGK
jgi:predicted DNA-binding protein